MNEQLDFQNINNTITPPDEAAMNMAQERWNSLCKPPNSLGRIEELVVRLAGICGTADIRIERKQLVIFCSDNGVLAEGISPHTSEMTTFMAKEFLAGGSASAVLCESTGTKLHAVDVGMMDDVPGMDSRKIARGTKNIAKEPAMTREEAIRGITVGMDLVKESKKAAFDLLLAGELGIGNTTTATAIISVMTDSLPAEITGAGAGVADGGIAHKAEVIQKAIDLHHPDKTDPIGVLSSLGGFDIAALCGYYIGAGMYRLPVVLDGVISMAAALLAKALVPVAADFWLPSHASKEPAALAAQKALGILPVINGALCLGEGTGGLFLLPLLELGVCTYQRMDRIEEIGGNT